MEKKDNFNSYLQNKITSICNWLNDKCSGILEVLNKTKKQMVLANMQVPQLCFTLCVLSGAMGIKARHFAMYLETVNLF